MYMIKVKARKIFSKAFRNKLEIKQEGRCYRCKIRMIRKTFHIDHKIALCNGGSNAENNLGLICKPCHKEKTSVDRQRWYENNRKQKSTLVHNNNIWYCEVMNKKYELKKKPALKQVKNKPDAMQILKAMQFGKGNVHIRLDKQILDFFRATGKGWQTRMNHVLRQFVDTAKENEEQ